MSRIKPTQELDCRGLTCPLPALKTKKTISRMASGDVLKVTVTDPGSADDLAAFCRRTGNEMLGQEESGGEFVFYLRKA